MTQESALLAGKPIGGWLAVLIFALALLGPIAAYGNYTEAQKILAAIQDKAPARQFVVATHVLLLVAYAILSIYTAHILWEKKRNAVATAKTNLIGLALLSVAARFCFPEMATFPREVSFDLWLFAFSGILRALIIYGIYYSYLSRSLRVKDTYTPDLPNNKPETTNAA